MTAIPLDAKPLPCTGHAASFDVLIEGRYSDRGQMQHVTARCLKLCNSCPIQSMCWLDNEGEDWVKRLKAVPKKRPCWHCGKDMVIGNRQHAKRYCDERCYAAAKREAQRGPDGIIHGSDTGYSQHNKRGEAACEPCKTAHRLMQKVRAARKREAA